MDEKKNINEIAEEVIDSIIPKEGDAAAAEQAQPDGQGEGAKKQKRSPIRYIIAGALLVYAAVILFRQYVFIPEAYEAPPTPVPTVELTTTPEPTPYVRKIPVKMYFTAREISFDVESVGIVPYTDAKGNQVVNEQGQKVYTM